MSEIYTIEDKPIAFMTAAWVEALAMFRIARRSSAVKLVICDIDDTLWRGVLAETESPSGTEIEGWPLGVLDALTALKKRGILLALASKNEEDRVAAIWRRLVGSRLSLDDFAVRRINWLPKVENITEIINLVNVLPSSVVFVDDNPVERAAIKASFPEMRVIGADPYSLKRILVWSAETQVPDITAEFGAKTEMI